MCFESLIMMIWAAGALYVYHNRLVPVDMFGTVNIVSVIARHFTPFNLSSLVVLAVMCLPVTSGDTALRSLRMVIADALNLNQKFLKNRLLIIIPSVIAVFLCLFYAKVHSDKFSYLWQYVMLFNQLLVIPTFLMATIYLYKNSKNYFITLIPGLLYIFITSAFIFNAKFGFNSDIKLSEFLAIILMFVSLYSIMKLCKKGKAEQK